MNFKTGQIILEQPIERTQMHKLLETGKTDLLDKFVSMRTRRAFKAMLARDAEAGKVNFEFSPSKFPPRKTAAKTAKPKAPRKTPTNAPSMPMPSCYRCLASPQVTMLEKLKAQPQGPADNMLKAIRYPGKLEGLVCAR